jgi:hypothetical protein
MYHKNEADLEGVENTINCEFLPQGVKETVKETQLGK